MEMVGSTIEIFMIYDDVVSLSYFKHLQKGLIRTIELVPYYFW